MPADANLAPIAYFCYARPAHTQRTLAALSRASLAHRSKLYAFCDGPPADASPDLLGRIAEVRALLRNSPWPGELVIVEEESNIGTRQSITGGVTRLTREYGRVIVVEDDIEVSEGFLEYMNEALTLYANDDQVFQINSFVEPHHASLPETSFTDTHNCWGWGTWQRAWEDREDDIPTLMAEIKRRGELRRFNLDGAFPIFRQLQRQHAGELNAWDPQWYASNFLAGRLSLIPNRSMVRNIGMDATGVHCESNPYYHIEHLKPRVKVIRQPIELHPPTRQAIVSWYRANRIKWRAKRFMELLRDDRPELWRRIKRYSRLAVEARLRD